jgi:UDP-N-acetylmuramoyl-L-alanine---L-glutamate ligase
MRVAELGSRRVAVWGLGREGVAAINLLRKHHPRLPLLLLDDSADARPPDRVGEGIECAFGAQRIADALEKVDVIVKSPGVSLYRREIQSAREKGVLVTSLLNLWFAQEFDVTTICVTGTKGKSTTASLIAHMLAKLGRRAALVGNIGVPITEIDSTVADYAVIEVSSYQAADFDGMCDVALLTSLHPEHIDWHRSVENYFRDKLNLLSHSRCCIVNRDAAELVERLGGVLARKHLYNEESGIHSCGSDIFDAEKRIGRVSDSYLARPHNKSNLCAALAALKSLGVDAAAALEAACGFRGLPHRQEELGEVGGILFVDDSISTIPESTIAALAVYAGRDIAVIVGGYDRGVDYSGLVATVMRGAAKAIICLGDSGQRICALARALSNQGQDPACAVYQATSMEDAVWFARRVTSPGDVILLSPAAPSYGHYHDYIERGRDFAVKAGLRNSSESDSHSELE